MEKKGMLILTILMMLIGFAAISTTLIINGSAKVSENTDDFSVIFTAATLDGTDVYANVIDDTKKIITFETSELKTKNQSSILTYEVTNNSANYDAEVTVNCKVKDSTEAKYTSIKNELENNATKVLAKETLNGTLTVTLEKSATEEVKEEYVCVLTFNAVERDTLGGYNGVREWMFNYTGEEQVFIAPIKGVYKIETWGAQGGSYNETYHGGYGGYSKGNIRIKEEEILYISVGLSGEDVYVENCTCAKTGSSSFNGGGSSRVTMNGNYYMSSGSGGGATHIALSSGLLSTFENNLDDLLIVSGGGGGAFFTTRLAYKENLRNASGGSGGGIKGESKLNATGATQDSGYQFGVGAPYNNLATAGAGGGGGYYGGNYTPGSQLNTTNYSLAGSGGSGYIKNSLLTDKSMYCYNCDESTEKNTKTISTTCASETPTENCAKIGNGYARITLIS